MPLKVNAFQVKFNWNISNGPCYGWKTFEYPKRNYIDLIGNLLATLGLSLDGNMLANVRTELVHSVARVHRGNGSTGADEIRN